MKPNVCRVCQHPRRVQIELAAMEGKSYRALGAQFGMSAASICRHIKGGHVAPTTAKRSENALQRAEAKHDDLLLNGLAELRSEVSSQYEEAKRAVRTVRTKDGEEVPIGRDFAPVVGLLKVAHQNLELVGRATGRFTSEANPGMGTATVIIMAEHTPCLTPGSAGALPAPEAEVIDIEPIR